MAATLKLNVVILGTTAIPESLLAEPLKKYFQQLDQALHFPCEIWIGGDGVWDYSSLEFKHSIRFFSTLDQLDRTLRDLALL
ncbi:MAG: hypothetical protein ABIQ95_08205 [Bdellovibrionia bacterium]